MLADVARQTALQLAQVASWRFAVHDEDGDVVAEGPARRPDLNTLADLITATNNPEPDAASPANGSGASNFGPGTASSGANGAASNPGAPRPAPPPTPAPPPAPAPPTAPARAVARVWTAPATGPPQPRKRSSAPGTGPAGHRAANDPPGPATWTTSRTGPTPTPPA